jgi:hypothetical protein
VRRRRARGRGPSRSPLPRRCGTTHRHALCCRPALQFPRASAKAALQGCVHLVTRPSSATALAAKPELAVAIGAALASSVQLPSLTVSGRQLGLQLWLKLLQVGRPGRGRGGPWNADARTPCSGQDLPAAPRILFKLAPAAMACTHQGFGGRLVADGGINLAARTAALVEGENDPRCLLLAFDCVRAAAGAAGARREEFAAEAGELFEVAVEPYFPVRFTPRKGDPSAITRAQLADAVAGCMAAAPEFAPLAVPLLSEKLGSSLRRACWVGD